MGLDPGDDEYTCSADHSACHASIFDDCTPSHVWANISGVEACPFYTDPVPNGSYRLAQDPGNANRWIRNDGIFNMVWFVSPTSTFGVLFAGLGLPTLFRSDHAVPCLSSFDNGLVCLAPPLFLVCIKGHCDITWGPDMPCGEI